MLNLMASNRKQRQQQTLSQYQPYMTSRSKDNSKSPFTSSKCFTNTSKKINESGVGKLNLSVDGEKTGSIKVDVPPASKGGVKVVLNKDLSKSNSAEDKVLIDQTD